MDRRLRLVGRLTDVTPLVSCASLRVLHLSKCSRLSDVGCLGSCPSLELLNLRCSAARFVPQRAGLRVSFDLHTDERLDEQGMRARESVGVL